MISLFQTVLADPLLPDHEGLAQASKIMTKVCH